MARCVLLLVVGLLLASSTAMADPGPTREAEHEESVLDPFRVCQKVNGWDYCVSYRQGECDVWMIAYGIQWCLVDDLPE